MSSTKTKKAPHRTAWLVFQSVLALAFGVIAIITVFQARDVVDPIIVDPTVGYSPTLVSELSNESHVGQWLMSTPLTWVAFALLILIWSCTLISRSFVPGVAATAIGMILLVIGSFVATGSSENTFSTWAKERYGIEIQDYPERETSIFSPEAKVNTNAIIILDDGQAVSVETFLNARSEEAIIIVDRSDATDSPDELDTIVEP